MIKNSKSYRTAALLVVPAIFVTIAIILAKGLNVNQQGLNILLNIQWEHLLKLDVSIIYLHSFAIEIKINNFDILNIFGVVLLH